MHLSVFMGPFSPTPYDDAGMIELCLDHAEQAAQAGFAMVTFGEQHFNGYEPYCNPFMMGARLSSVLGKTWFGVTACPFVLRNPLRLAEDMSVLDVLMKGRLLVGLSGGRPGFTKDFECFGIDPAKRDEVFSAKLKVMEQAWGQQPGDEPLEYEIDGERGALHGRLMPMSWRKPRPLYAFATSTESKIEDAGRRGLPILMGPMPQQLAVLRLSQHRKAMIEAGIDEALQAECIEKSGCLLHVICGEDEDAAWQRAEVMNKSNIMLNRSDKRSLRELAEVDPRQLDSDPYPRNVQAVHGGMIVGTPEKVAERLKNYRDDGVHNLITRFTFGPPDKELLNDNFRLFCERAMPLLPHKHFSELSANQVHRKQSSGVDKSCA